MSVTSVRSDVRTRLWGKAGGRCQYDGCNKPLWLDTLTKAEFNTSYIAHIIADEPGGPRGDAVLSKELKSDISNLMLLCDEHHRLVDKADVPGHPVDRLLGMKELHEKRIELVTALGPQKRSHVVLYGANIGQQNAPLSMAKAAEAMLPDRYPAEARPIALGLVNSGITDRDDAYWKTESQQLSRLIEQQVRPRLGQGEVHHFSILALAPQPLLTMLGYLLSDIPAAEVYQLHREPPNWKWQDDPEGFAYEVVAPADTSGVPALVFSLSATINDERIQAVIPKASIWRVTVPSPNNDFLKSWRQASLFRVTMRSLLDRIKAEHGEHSTLHVFPAMPVALAVDFGRVIMPKADLKMILYDQNRALGGFVRALEIQQRS
ncbi:MAG TPA: HNH endonuclease [Bryobacteraceae bacterium]|nr:HNH endonuclease [Bryobacteraceae bacterium]